MLWGGHAQSKLPLIEATQDQLILQSSHPSGLGVYKTEKSFLEPSAKASCGHFTKANEWLIAKQQSPIQWVDSHASHTDKDLFSLSS
jgi:uracil-DNA glycosylase